MTDRLTELVKLLNRYAAAYYQGEPVVSDSEYDALYDELAALETEAGFVLPDSPTAAVGTKVASGYAKHTHLSRLLSLDKCQSIEELIAWGDKVKGEFGHATFTVEHKYDGLTLCLTYKGGRLVTAATRGDGVVGEVVTLQVSAIDNVPNSIPYKGTMEVACEGIMHLSTLERYNKSAAVPLKNARNAAAGGIRNLDPGIVKERGLSVVAYSINHIDDETVTSQTEAFGLLSKCGFECSKHKHYETISEVIDYIKTVDRDSLDFLIDGMVIKVSEYSVREELGVTVKFPKWAVAYKWAADEIRTKLLDIDWQVGRTGKLTPTAILKPVDIAGVTVSRATLNNYADITRKSVRLNDEVILRRSNDVIPEILRAVGGGDTNVVMPTHCPSCNSTLIFDDINLFCPNLECPPRVIAGLIHFCSKDCFDLGGVSIKTIEQLYHKLGVRSFADLYRLGDDALGMLEGFGDKKIIGYTKAIEASKSIELHRFVYGLGILGVGKKTAQDLAAVFGSLDALRAASIDALRAVPNIGEVVAVSIKEFFDDNAVIVDDLLAQGISPISRSAAGGGALSGTKIVITGTFLDYKRSELSKALEERGAEVQSSVTNTTDIVIAGENAGSKLGKAQALGKKILGEKDIITLLS